MRGRRGWLLAYCVATVLAFPHALPEGSPLPVIDLGWLASWAVAPTLILGLRGLAPRQAAKTAFLASMLAHVFVFHWFIVVTVTYGHAPLAIGIFAPLVPAYWVSQFTVLFAVLWTFSGRYGLASPVSAAVIWVVVDHFRGMLFRGWPWATLGYGLHQDAGLMPLTRYFGVYGLSFIAVVGGCALFDWLRRPGRVPLRSELAALVAIAVLHIVGFAVPDVVAEDATTVRIAAIQGNVDQGTKWSSQRLAEILGRYERLSREAISDGAEVVVWPETAIPAALELDAGLRARIERLARERGTVLVVGSMGVTTDATQSRVTHYFDSAFVVSGRGELLDRYDKTHLVPFGEFVPLRGLIGTLISGFATGVSSSDVSAGPRSRAIELPRSLSGSEANGSLRVGIPICYELLFPHEVSPMVEDGAGVLLAITNDAWYGRTGAPYQFLVMTAMRAAENGRWLVRAANTGVSAIIDSRGAVRESTPIFEPGILVYDVPVEGPEASRTLQTRFPNGFAALCWVALVGGGISGRRKGSLVQQSGESADG